MKLLFEQWLKIRYTLYSPLYDLLIGRLFTGLRKRSISLANIQPEESVLIVGAGTGLDLEFLSSNARDITAIDLSEGMLNKLKRRAKRLNLNVSAEVMDAKNMSYNDRSFDVIILHMIIAVIPDYVQCLKEVNRVLKPGGRIVIFDKFLPKNAPSLFRKLFNPLAILIASDLNLKVEELRYLNMTKVHEEQTGIFGLFRILKFQKD